MDSLLPLPFRLIGSGFCGSIWAPPEEKDSFALKREDGGPGRSLANDHCMHKRVLTCLDQLKLRTSSAQRVQVRVVFVSSKQLILHGGVRIFPDFHKGIRRAIFSNQNASPRSPDRSENA
jgi:hypothetical protein